MTAPIPIDGSRHVFVCGLHRSGTTLLASCLAQHPDVSGFANTGAIEDEGQFLQTVYPPARDFGGPGLFGFAPEMHLTEASDLISDAHRARMFREWSSYWDVERRLLLEKSPPNLLKMRFLQAMFPGAAFIVCVRHPLAVSLATSKWKKGLGIDRLVHHWVRCHELAIEDLRLIERARVVSYEQFVEDPSGVLGGLDSWLGLGVHRRELAVRTGVNDSYAAQWSTLCRRAFRGRAARRAIARYAADAELLGYSFSDWSRTDLNVWDSVTRGPSC